MPDLSVLIAARREMFLNRTIQDVLAHSKADTEIIVVLDGDWAEENIPQHPQVHVVYQPISIGQRAAVNLAAAMSRSEFVCKLDAHVAVSDGWDIELIRAARTLGPDVIQIPAQHNLHVFDWLCEACGRRTYQGPTPTTCNARDKREERDRGAGCGTDGPFRRDIVWDAVRRRTETWCFDSTLHFQYDGHIQLRAEKAAKDRGEPTPEFLETMSCLGACWFLSRAYFWQLGGLDESLGSWGQMGQEIACKTWLSGGRMVTNRRTWFSHLFRTQGLDFGFPYPQDGEQVTHARTASRAIWLNNAWPQQIHPLRWLVEKFFPIKGWTKEQVDALPRELPRINSAEREQDRHRGGSDCATSIGAAGRDSQHRLREHRGGDGGLRASVHIESHNNTWHGLSPDRPGLTKGCIWYSDCRPAPEILRASQRSVEASGLPIVAVTLKPIDWMCAGSIVLPLERGYLTMFRQILAGLEALDTDVVFFCEHDVIYSREHFAFAPPRADTFYYNQHVYKVDVESGKALHYLCSQTSGLCCNRQLAITHYRARVARVERDGFSRTMGFEPGTRKIRHGGVDDALSDTWMSTIPNVDLRHRLNLTPSRWKKEQFKNQKYTAGWTESDSVPGFGVTRGRMPQVLREFAQPRPDPESLVDTHGLAGEANQATNRVGVQDVAVNGAAVGVHA